MIATYLRNLLTNWASYGLNVVVAFFLTPFIARSLGESGYGVWSLLMAITGYMGLVDLGVRVSTGRYLNYHLGRNELDKARDVIRTSLALYSGVGVVILAVAGILGHWFPTLFPRLPAELTSSADVVLFLLGINVWIGLYTATFGQLLLANNRFDIKNAIDVMALITRSTGTVFVLQRQAGIEGLAAVLLITGIVEFGATFVMGRIWGASLRDIGPRIDVEHLSMLIRFSAWSFIANLGSRVILYTDSIVIAALLGARELAVYAVGLMLIDYAANFLAQIASVATPDIYKMAGSGKLKELERLALGVGETSLAVAVPGLVALALLATDFVRLWMGPSYQDAGAIVKILAAGHLVFLASRGLGAALWGAGEVKTLAAATAVEAAVNLTLSISFVTIFGFGIRGVAAGTIIPMALHAGLFLPVLASRKLGISPRAFWSTTLRWTIAAGAFALAGSLLLRAWPVDTWIDFARSCVVLLVLYIPFAVAALGGPAAVRRRVHAAWQPPVPLSH